MSRSRDPRPPQSKIDPKVLDARSLVRMARLAGESLDAQVRALSEVPLRAEMKESTSGEILRQVLALTHAEQDPAQQLRFIERLVHEHLRAISPQHEAH